ncbi:hypothetical protein EsHS_00006733 [Epichloe bromicola]
MELLTILSFFLGGIIGSITTQLLVPTASWGSCRWLGIATATRTRAASATAPAPPWQSSSNTNTLVRVNGTYNLRSPFTGPPSPEVFEAWEGRYWPVWMFGVDEAAFRASHPQHMSSAVRVDGGAHDGHYLATFEASHQLHCLFNLYRASYLDYGGEERLAYEENPATWHARVDHCVDILRQKLECDRDTTLITYNWVRGKKGPTANFNVERECPDAAWTELSGWLQQHQITRVPTKPANVTELPAIP